MSYQEQIEQYKTGQMSEVEKMVFEQELADNAALRKAYEADLLLEEVLSFTNANLPNKKGHPVQEQPTFSLQPYLIGLGSVLVLGLLFFTTQNDTVSTVTVNKVEEAPIENTTQKLLSTPEIKESIFIEYEDEVPPPAKKEVPKKQPSKPVKKASTLSIPFAVQTTPVKEEKYVALDAPSSSSETTTGVILEAGFSITASESFSAEIKDGKTMVTKSSPVSIEAFEVVGEQGSVAFEAGKTITLGPGFEVPTGTIFTATITP